MKREEIVRMAKYICFPYVNESYSQKYDGIDREVHRIPIVEGKDVLYSRMPTNEHHYTTDYAYTYVLPLLDSLLGFGFSIGDFTKVPLKLRTGDLSYIVPKTECLFTAVCFTDNVVSRGGYTSLFEDCFKSSPSYRPLYRYHHRCSRIVNHTTKSKRKLMVSGDSQMVPCIAPLAYYFREVWYFDNRTGYFKNRETNQFEFHGDRFKSFQDRYRDTVFTDSVIELYSRDLKWYEYWNLY